MKRIVLMLLSASSFSYSFGQKLLITDTLRAKKVNADTVKAKVLLGDNALLYNGAGYAFDTNVVHKKGNELIENTKIFNHRIIVNGSQTPDSAKIEMQLSNSSGLLLKGNDTTYKNADMGISRLHSSARPGHSPSLQFNDLQLNKSILIQSNKDNLIFFRFSNTLDTVTNYLDTFWHETARIDSFSNLIVKGKGLFEGTVSGIPAVNSSDFVTLSQITSGDANTLHKTGDETKSDGTLTISRYLTSDSVFGSSVANGSLILNGTSHATKTTSELLMQTTGGKVGVGHTDANKATFDLYGANFWHEHNSSRGGEIFIRNLGTRAAPLPPTHNANLGQVMAGNWDGTAFGTDRRAGMRMLADSPWSATNNGASILFTATEIGEAAINNSLHVMRVNHDGNVLVQPNADTPIVNISARFAVHDTKRGMLIPRMTTTQMNAIASPVVGLLVWNTTDSTIYQYRGLGGWKSMDYKIKISAPTSNTLRFIQRTDTTDVNINTSAVWGTLTGLLSNQTDLNDALNARLQKSDSSGATGFTTIAKHRKDSADTKALIDANAQILGMNATASINSFAPADASTYYAGSIPSNNLTGGTTRVYVSKGGTIKRAIVFFQQTGGTSETSSVYVRVNNTSDNLISSSVVNDATATVVSNTSMNVSINALDYIEIKWITPSWVTNPTSVKVSATIYIE